ncbi:MAG: YdaS family helix-turn-helix protein [Kiritimatiellia bacterium]|jgi:DNA-binding transcriptional regulator YdaS (Cro superfamily)
MSKLKAIIDSRPRQERRAFREYLANQLGVSEVMIRHMANGTRGIAAEHVLKLESALKGEATRHELRPDLYPQEAA